MMKNKGLHQYRFSHDNNKLEWLFAKMWEAQNNKQPGRRHGTLDHLLAKDNHPAGEVRDRDRQVAATVVQWLGSPIGQGFLNEVFDRIDDEKIQHRLLTRQDILERLKLAVQVLERNVAFIEEGDEVDEHVYKPLKKMVATLSLTDEEYFSEKGW